MMHRIRTLLALLFLLYPNLWANQESNESEQLLYLSYAQLPQKLFVGEIFEVKIKIIDTSHAKEPLHVQIGGFDGLSIVTKEPIRTVDGYTLYDTYYFQATRTLVKLPDLFYAHSQDKLSTLRGAFVHATQLTPPENFSGVLANDLFVLRTKTTHYDNESNILLFTLEGELANFVNFNLSQFSQQGKESLEFTPPLSRLTYFVLLPKEQKALQFSYFNLTTRSYSVVTLPIELVEDRVSTQMDLTPTQNTHTLPKIILASLLALVGIVLYWVSRKRRYFFVIALAPLLYISWVYFPKQTLCIKENANIYLLPTRTATIFEKLTTQQEFPKLGKSNGYYKILMPNQVIGWIKPDDICKN